MLSRRKISANSKLLRTVFLYTYTIILSFVSILAYLTYKTLLQNTLCFSLLKCSPFIPIPNQNKSLINNSYTFWKSIAQFILRLSTLLCNIKCPFCNTNPHYLLRMPEIRPLLPFLATKISFSIKYSSEEKLALESHLKALYAMWGFEDRRRLGEFRGSEGGK